MADIKTIPGNTDINDTYDRIYSNDDSINQELEGHINGSSNRHSTKDINDNSNVSGANQEEVNNQLKGQIDSIVVGGTEVDPRVSQAMVDTEGTVWNNFKDEQDAWQNRTKTIENTFYTDMEAYYGNTLDLFDNKDDFVISATGATITRDYSTYKLRNYSFKLEKTSVTSNVCYGYLELNSTLDIEKFINNTIVNSDDYLIIPIYISDTTNLTSVKIVFFDSNSEYYHISTSEWANINYVTGWNYVKIDFEFTSQSANFNKNDVTKIRLDITTNNIDDLITVNFGDLFFCKKDPVYDYPNPMQKNGVADFSINSGEWYVIKENGQIKLMELTGSIYDVDSLSNNNYFDNFECNLITSTNISAEDRYLAFVSEVSGTSTRVEYYIYSNLIRGRVVNNSVVKEVKDISFPINANDILNYTVSRNGEKWNLKLYKNNDLSTLVEIELTNTNLEKYNLNIGVLAYSNIRTIYSASITNLSHAHHSDVAEYSKIVNTNVILTAGKSGNQPLDNDIYENILFDVIDNNIGVYTEDGITFKMLTSGEFKFDCDFAFDTNETGSRYYVIDKNATFEKFIILSPTTSNTIGEINPTITFKKGDTFKIQMRQNSGVQLDCIGAYTKIKITKVGD